MTDEDKLTRRKPVISADDRIEGSLLTKVEEFTFSWEEKTKLMLKRARKRQATWEKKVKDATQEIAELQVQIDDIEEQLRRGNDEARTKPGA